MKFELIPCLLIFNGIWDHISCLAILVSRRGPHLTLFVLPPDDSATYRFMAYWILTYGWIRLMCGIYWAQCPQCKFLAVTTYVIEAVGFEYEWYVGKAISRNKVSCITALCALCVVVISQVYN
jgi:hypothetical protein